MSTVGGVTFLGRGSTDTTAVALAAALAADACELYTDVAGVYTADPRLAADARMLSHVHFDEMLAMCAAGCPKPATDAVELARERGVSLHVRSAVDGASGTWIDGSASDAADPIIAMVADWTANQLARFLHAREAVSPGHRVALLFDDPVDAYAAMLAVLKVRAAYVPLEPGFPPDRSLPHVLRRRGQDRVDPLAPGRSAVRARRAVELIARQWVRQEAYLKGVGTGIAHGLTTPRGDGEAAQAGSTLVDVPVAGGLSAAVAVAALSP